MSVYAYNNADADASSQDLQNVMSQIESTLSEMDSDIRKLASAWEGSEQEEYQGIHGRWSSAATNIKEILGQVRAALDENSASVSETRGRASAAIQG
ncbi:MAG: WXG100 family type VII secretion target [Corynebacterium sp.]|uniref:WXG100 family type VII secretion target n=1 Tax=Corynebacterium sp. TaxID=1720 RepID=UPI0026DEE9AC|nr:WXG100 family type VII secretion target [Corynebacterium sp.]MDO5670441.1 WXG100 family type VII secretion target [Corynebacterium sp.]